ncbi:YciI family protein [Sorangium sp. So ce406]|uniref:YciI family protein n=1 Tax=Sorangium sp. So ce406 TaxID=3133311 RepID=UPI003F5B9D32
MRFMMLIHHDEAALAAAPQKELGAEYGAFKEALDKAEGCSAGERLQPSSAATTVRRHDGKTEVLDGPYADTKEQFAGYFIIEAPSLDEAIVWAKRCPSSKYGSIEIRPIVDAQAGWKR